jgi:ADP-glucose pyrophosphorylase
VLLFGARVEAGAQIVDSIVGPAAVVETEVIASDQSIIGPDAVVSAGTHVAGARVDAAGAAL